MMIPNFLLGLFALLPFAQLAAAQAAVFGQCGGIGFTGPTTCVAGSTCTELNDFFFQCLPNASSTPAPNPTSPPTSPPSSGSGSLASIPASKLTQIFNFGPNPANVQMFVYKPAKVAPNPALIVASHFCTGTAQIYFQNSKFAPLAETHGYVVLFPSSPHPGTCWDVSSDATLTHNAGGDSLGIASAARFAIANWGVDPARVFAVGTSSGAMMTNVLAGAYPDVFKAGIVDSGVAFGCFALPNSPPATFDETCALGQVVLTGQQWAQRVFNAFPGFAGARPKIQIWHGTADTTLFPQNFVEEIKQWTTVFGYPNTPLSNVSEPTLPRGYSNATFGPNFQAILAQGVGHTVPLFEQLYLEFLGIA